MKGHQNPGTVHWSLIYARYAAHIVPSDRPSVCPSVCLSVCVSVCGCLWTERGSKGQQDGWGTEEGVHVYVKVGRSLPR
jgi:hypothetical protein